MTEQQFNKLPKFAQAEIRRLRSNISEADKNINKMFSTEISNTQFRYNMGMKNLPENSNVRFNLPGMNYIDIIVTGGKLRVYGNTSIKILPQASNSIHLTISD